MPPKTEVAPKLTQNDIDLANVIDVARECGKAVFAIGYVKYDPITNTNRLHCFRQTRSFPTQDINEFVRMLQEELSKDVKGGSPSNPEDDDEERH